MSTGRRRGGFSLTPGSHRQGLTISEVLRYYEIPATAASAADG